MTHVALTRCVNWK